MKLAELKSLKVNDVVRLTSSFDGHTLITYIDTVTERGVTLMDIWAKDDNDVEFDYGIDYVYCEDHPDYKFDEELDCFYYELNEKLFECEFEDMDKEFAERCPQYLL